MIASFLLGTTLLAQDPAARTLEATRHAEAAAAATREHDFARAEEEWKRVIALDVRSPQAFHNLGMIYYLEHKYPEAEESLAKALQLDPALANARVLLGASLARQGKSERATEELERALKARLSESAEKTARVALHEAWTARGNYARALEVLKPLVEKYPQDVDLLYSLGETYLLLSTRSFERIAEIDLGSYRVHQLLAEALAKQGKYREAIREYRLALEQKQDLPGVHYQIGLLYRIYENTPESDSEALKEFQAELKINPFDPASEYRLARIYWKRRELEKAIEHFDRSVRLDESYADSRLALARALEAAGRLDDAQKLLEETAKRFPENPNAHYRLAQLYKRRGQARAAAEELKKFEEIRSAQSSRSRPLEKALGGTAEPEAGDEQEQ